MVFLGGMALLWLGGQGGLLHGACKRNEEHCGLALGVCPQEAGTRETGGGHSMRLHHALWAAGNPGVPSSPSSCLALPQVLAEPLPCAGQGPPPRSLEPPEVTGFCVRN